MEKKFKVWVNENERSTNPDWAKTLENLKTTETIPGKIESKKNTKEEEKSREINRETIIEEKRRSALNSYAENIQELPKQEKNKLLQIISGESIEDEGENIPFKEKIKRKIDATTNPQEKQFLQKIADIYEEKTKPMEEAIVKCSENGQIDGKRFFENLLGYPPEGDVEVQVDDFSVRLICPKGNDYKAIACYPEKNCRTFDIAGSFGNINRIPVTVEDTGTKSALQWFGIIDNAGEHEEQHAINNFFEHLNRKLTEGQPEKQKASHSEQIKKIKKEIDEKDAELKDVWKNSSMMSDEELKDKIAMLNEERANKIREMEDLLEDIMRKDRGIAEEKAKDEILAFLTGDSLFTKITDIFYNLQRKNRIVSTLTSPDGPYDFTKGKVDEVSGPDYVYSKYFEKDINVQDLAKKIYIDEYEKVLEDGVNSFLSLEKLGLSRKKCIPLFINEPLRNWPQLVNKFRANAEKI